jgi:hypothetical protein
MQIVKKINNTEIIDVFLGSPKYLDIPKINNISTGAHKFATTSSKVSNFRMVQIVTTIPYYVISKNNLVITDYVQRSSGISNSPFTWDFSTHIGDTDLYFSDINLDEITLLNFFASKIDTLNVGGMTSLESLNVIYSNLLTTIDLTFNTNLTYLSIQYTGINSTSNLIGVINTSLEVFDCRNQNLTTLGIIETVTTLIGLIANNNTISAIDLSLLVNLSFLSVYNNSLTAIDTSNNPLLSIFSAYNNDITSLDFSNNPLLIDAYINGNVNLTSCDISSNTILQKFRGTNLNSFVGPLTLNSSSLIQLTASGTFSSLVGYNVAALEIFEITGQNNGLAVDLSNATLLEQFKIGGGDSVSSLVLPTTLNGLTIFQTTNNPTFHLLTVDYTIMTNVTQFILDGCNLTSGQLDTAHIDIDANTSVVGSIDTSGQTGGGSPTATSLAARNNLITNGWTITI